MAVLVLVFNAARSCPTMPALFSDHTFRHYAYLRDSLSHLVPPLRVGCRGRESAGPRFLRALFPAQLMSSLPSPQLPGSGLDLVDSRYGSASVESPQLFLQQSLNRVSTIQNLEAPGAQELLDLTIRLRILAKFAALATVIVACSLTRETPVRMNQLLAVC